MDYNEYNLMVPVINNGTWYLASRNPDPEWTTETDYALWRYQNETGEDVPDGWCLFDGVVTKTPKLMTDSELACRLEEGTIRKQKATIAAKVRDIITYPNWSPLQRLLVLRVLGTQDGLPVDMQSTPETLLLRYSMRHS